MAGEILVIRGGAIGDFILTLPVLAALRSQFPETRLEVLGYEHIASLALAGGLVDAVRSIEAGELAGFFARNGELDPGLGEYFARFNIIVSYLYDPDEVFQANVKRCSRAQFIQGPHRPSDRGRLPAAEVFLEPLTRLAIFDANAVPTLTLTAAMGAEHEVGPGGGAIRLGMHPGSGSERKNWPEARWRRLIERIVGETDWELLIVSGEAEEGRVDRLSAGVPADRLQHAHNWPLPRLGRVLKTCDLFLGHDSGITHLAGALGIRGLVLWGESVEHVWRPPSPNVVVVRHAGGLTSLDVREVFDRLTSGTKGKRVE